MAFPKIEGYVVTERLGSGSYSTVYKAYTKVGARSTVAIKCVDKSRVKQSGSAIDNLITEIRLLKTLTHPHIVHMKHFTWDDKNIYIIMEYCCGGDLSRYIHRYGRVPEKQVLYFLQQLASALKFLREKGVVHMDLKPHNLLLHKGGDGKYILKVADFGFAQHLTQQWGSAVRGSPLYMAPEVLAGRFDARADLWSVGVILYECLFGRAPYSSATFRELVDKIQRRAPILIPKNSSISAGCRDLLTRLLQHDPDQRITYEEFFAHEYLDLDHMPTKENYEKAVGLIKQAIALDAGGRAAAALAAYAHSLRLLVPCVRAEPDALRRAALKGKLSRYMERAEEIKEFLKQSSVQQVSAPPDNGPVSAPPDTGPVSDDGRAAGQPDGHAPDHHSSVNGNDDTNRLAETCVAVGLPRKRDASGGEGGQGGKEQGGGRHAEPAAGSRRRSPGARGPLRRLFARGPAVPYLDTGDCSITEETSQNKEQKQPVGETANEGCKIT